MNEEKIKIKRNFIFNTFQFDIVFITHVYSGEKDKRIQYGVRNVKMETESFTLLSYHPLIIHSCNYN